MEPRIKIANTKELSREEERAQAMEQIMKNSYEAKSIFGNLNICESLDRGLQTNRFVCVLWDDEVEIIAKVNKVKFKIIAFRKNGVGEIINC